MRYKYVLFWIKSSRGTDEISVRVIPARYKSDDIKEELEAWCSNFGAWTNSDSYTTYGWRPLRPRNRKLLKREEVMLRDKVAELQKSMQWYFALMLASGRRQRLDGPYVLYSFSADGRTSDTHAARFQNGVTDYEIEKHVAEVKKHLEDSKHTIYGGRHLTAKWERIKERPTQAQATNRYLRLRKQLDKAKRDLLITRGLLKRPKVAA